MARLVLRALAAIALAAAVIRGGAAQQPGAVVPVPSSSHGVALFGPGGALLLGGYKSAASSGATWSNECTRMAFKQDGLDAKPISGCPQLARSCGIGIMGPPAHPGAPPSTSAAFIAFGGEAPGASPTGATLVITDDSQSPLRYAAAAGLSPSPPATADHSCAQVLVRDAEPSSPSLLYVSGGRGAGGALSSNVWMLSVDVGAWWRAHRRARPAVATLEPSALTPHMRWSMRSTGRFEPRSGHSMEVLGNGTLALAGGLLSNGSLARDLIMSWDGGATWMLMSAAFPPRVGFQLALTSLGVVAVGGNGADGRPTGNMAVSFDQGFTWELRTLPDGLGARVGAAYMADETSVAVIGGMFGAGPAAVGTRDLWVLDLEDAADPESFNWTTLIAPNSNRWMAAAATSLTGATLVMGGRSGSYVHDTYVVAYRTPSFSLSDPMPLPFSARYGAAAATLATGTIVVVGGCALGVDGTPSPVADAWSSSDANAATWSRVSASLPFQPRCGAPMVALNNALLYIGGLSGSGQPGAYLSLNGGASWSLAAQLPTWVDGASATVSPSGIVYVVGGNGTSALMRSADNGATWEVLAAAISSWPHAFYSTALATSETSITVIGGYAAGAAASSPGAPSYGRFSVSGGSATFTAVGDVPGTPGLPRGGAAAVSLVPAVGAYVFFGEAQAVFYLNFTSLAVSGVCQPGFGSDGANCRPCASNTYSAGGPGSQCTACAAGSVASPGSSACRSCAAPFIPGALGRCVCPAGQGPSSNFLSCQPCSPNSFSHPNLTDSCAPCPPGGYSGPGSAQCAACPAGSDSRPGSPCAACAAGQFSISGAPCTPCTPGSFSSANASSCAPCPGGQAAPPGSSSCTACAPGTFAAPGAASTCSPCAAGAFSGAAAASCAPCPLGSFTSNGTACPACPPGTFSLAGAARCLPCPPGFFAPATGQGACTRCPANETSASGASRCDACPPNQRSLDGGLTCACRPGYVNSTSSRQCELPCVAPAIFNATLDSCVTSGGSQPQCRLPGSVFDAAARSCVCGSQFEPVGAACLSRCNATTEARSAQTGQCICRAEFVSDGTGCVRLPPGIEAAPPRGNEPSTASTLQLESNVTSVSQFVTEVWPGIRSFVWNVTLSSVSHLVSRISIRRVQIGAIAAGRRRLLSERRAVAADFDVVFISTADAETTTAAAQTGLQAPAFTSGLQASVPSVSVVAISSTTQLPVCANGVLDASEADVDCGGVSCAPCSSGKACLRSADCGSGLTCANNVCSPVPGEDSKINVAAAWAVPFSLFGVGVIGFLIYHFCLRKDKSHKVADSSTAGGGRVSTTNIVAGQLDFEMGSASRSTQRH